MKNTAIVLALLFCLDSKAQSIHEILSKSKMAYDTSNVIIDCKVKVLKMIKTTHSTNHDSTVIYGKLYYRTEPSDQHFLLETSSWNFIRNKKYFGYNDNRKNEYNTLPPRNYPPFLSERLDNELLLPFLYDTSFFHGRFTNRENNTASLITYDSFYIIKRLYASSDSANKEPVTINEAYFINKKTFLIYRRTQGFISIHSSMEPKQAMETSYKYSHTSKKVVNDKIDDFKPYPEKKK